MTSTPLPLSLVAASMACASEYVNSNEDHHDGPTRAHLMLS